MRVFFTCFRFKRAWLWQSKTKSLTKAISNLKAERAHFSNLSMRLTLLRLLIPEGKPSSSIPIFLWSSSLKPVAWKHWIWSFDQSHLKSQSEAVSNLISNKVGFAPYGRWSLKTPFVRSPNRKAFGLRPNRAFFIFCGCKQAWPWKIKKALTLSREGF